MTGRASLPGRQPNLNGGVAPVFHRLPGRRGRAARPGGSDTACRVGRVNSQAFFMPHSPAMRMRDTNTCKRLATWVPCVALGVGSMLAAGALSLAPPPGGPIAVLYPPWWSASRSLLAAAAGGMPVRFGATSFVVVVIPDTPDAARLLRQAGAWLLLDPRALGGCVAA